MAGYTLAQAQTQLDEALAELSRARKAASYSIGNRSKANQRLEAANADVDKWNREVKKLTRGGISMRGITNVES